MSNITKIRSKADLIISLIPQAADAVHPHGPIVSNAHVELLVADVVKHVGTALADKAASKNVLDLSQKMASQASSSLLGAWVQEPGDELCPPWFGPRPHRLEVSEPEPQPWKAITSAEQIELAYVLTNLAGLTSSAEFNTSLKSMATSIARGAATKLAEDFEKCGTVPRRPIPRPHYAEAKGA